MEWYDYLTLTALIVIFTIGMRGEYKAYKRKKKQPQPNFKPRHYEDFDKRLE